MAATILLCTFAAVARADEFPVTNTDDTGAGSLRAAITAANTNSGELDVVNASGVVGTINLQSALPDLTDDIEIRGPGADLLTVRRDAGGDYRIFTVPAGVEAEISGLTIANGSVAGEGGGIRSEGALTLRDSAVSENSAAGDGGGIYSLGTATIDRTTVEGNSTGDDGGGIVNFNTMMIANSTMTGNSAPERGGGIVNNGDDLLTVTSTTIANNTANDGANIFQASIGSPLPLVLISTILADPIGSQNCATGGGGQYDSQGYNLDDDDSCDLVEDTDQPNGDAKLRPLSDNGGATQTLAPRPVSDAIDQGVSDGLTIDQRSLPRPFDFPDLANAAGGDGSDIGAVELQADEEDVTGPQTTITKRPKKKILTDKRRVRARFRFAATDDISPVDTLTFECKLDRKPLKPCDSPFKKKLKLGKHKFRVFATDEVGNTDPTPAKFRFKVKREN